jgi:hypothetical protein
MIGVVEVQGEEPAFRVDDDRDGTMDRNYAPTRLSSMEKEGEQGQPAVAPGMFLYGGVGLVLIVGAAGVLAMWLIFRGKRNRTPL